MERECGRRLGAIGDDFVGVEAVDSDSARAGTASIGDTDGGAEGVILAVEVELESGVGIRSRGLEFDGSGPRGTVHVVVGLVVECVRALSGGDADGGEERANFGAVVGGVDVADGGIGSAVGVVLLLFAGLDAELLVGVPETVAIGLASCLGDVGRTTRRNTLRDAPVTSGVEVAVSFSGGCAVGLAVTSSSDVAT